MWDDSEVASLGPALAGLPSMAYNEEAFRYFLEIERNRIARSQRSSVLVLVSLKPQPDKDLHMVAAIAAKVFAGLSLCVREVDFAGWYREGRVAAAVLAQGTDTVTSETSDRIHRRMAGVIADQLPANVARRVRVRLVHLRPAKKS